MTQHNHPDAAEEDHPRRAPARGPADRAAQARAPTPRDPGSAESARPPLGGMQAARHAAGKIRELTGRQPEHVVSVAKQDGGWQIGLEVVELHRIPDTADVLAVYEVTLDARGRLVTCSRERRYLRGSTDECRW